MSMEVEDINFIRELIKKHAAISLGDDKSYLVESRMSMLMGRKGLKSLNELMKQVRSRDEKIIADVVDVMTTNETYFFRDTHPFEILSTQVIPEMLRKKNVGKPLSIWCAACSTGQEPFSIAMLLKEKFPTYNSNSFQIIATDISSSVLEKARQGRFTQIEINRGMPATLLARYFRKNGMDWYINDEIKKMVSFKELNLIKEWSGIPEVDIIFLRNVLIYFDVTTKSEVLKKASQALTMNGALFLGSSENTINLVDNFQKVAVQKSWYYQKVA